MAVKKRVKVKRAVRRLAITGPICIILIGYSIYTIFSYAFKIYELQNEKQYLEETKEILIDTKEQLAEELVKLQDEDYLARYARENYLYSKEGEYIIKIEETENELKEVEQEYNQSKVIGVIIGVSTAIILFIIFKKDKTETKKGK